MQNRFKDGFFWVGALVLFFSAALRADVTVVFNEVMYHPVQTNEAEFEWVELRNQMAVDMDISGWSFEGGVNYLFPEETVIPGRGFLVVAASPGTLTAATGVTNVLGPYTGRLSNGGEKLELRNNNNRLMDLLDYGTDDNWPVAADGAGPSLAKIDEDSGSADPANWWTGSRAGGTPGTCNHPEMTVTVDPDAIQLDSHWQYIADGSDPGGEWKTADFEDSGWSTGNGIFASSEESPWIGETQAIDTLFSSGVNAEGQVLAPGQLDPHYSLTASAYSTPPPPDISATVMANHSAWLANNAISSWIGVISGPSSVSSGSYNFRTTFDLSGMDPDTAAVALRFAADDRVNQVLLNGVDQGVSYVGYSAFSALFNLSSGFTEGTNTLDFYTVNDSTAANPAGFRVEAAGTVVGGMTPGTLLTASLDTRYFRKTFVVDGDPATAALVLRTVLDDGAVFYLNGSEVLRLNLPAGTISHTTCSVTNVIEAGLSGRYPISTLNLVEGTNVLAVEVHQAATGSGDIVFGAELSLTLTNNLPPSLPSLAFNELSGVTAQVFQVELYNFASQSITVSNCTLQCLGAIDREYLIPSQTISSGGRIVIESTALGFDVEAGDRLVFYALDGVAVVDAVTARSYPRARWPEGTGVWLHPSTLTPGATNCITFHDEIVINEIMYNPRNPQGTTVEFQEQWIELYNRGVDTVDLSSWRLEIDEKTAFRFPAGVTVASGGYLVVASDAAYLQGVYPAVDIIGDLDEDLSGSSARIELFDDAAAPLDPAVDPDEAGNLVDIVSYADRIPWASLPDGLGASLELCDPRSDNFQPEAWAASDDKSKATWQAYTYNGVAAAETASSPTQWKEFVLGLIGEGEILLDDISVIEDPDGTAIELIQNSSFESGGDSWRIIGNHRHSEVIVDPDNAANHVLRLVSKGYTEHMHNHAETTLAYGVSVVNGREYQISYRAKWVAGCNRLLSRLYFNRLPQLTEIAQPSLNGTPGAQNSCYTPNRGPTFSNLSHLPVVPESGESVDIAVRASDMDGISSAVLHYAVDSGAWQTAFAIVSAAAEGVVNIEASIPGQSSDAVVQFYVEAVDSIGASSTAPRAGVASRALYEVAGATAVNPKLHTVRIVMTPADTEFLHSSTNVMSNERIGCTLITDERSVAYDAALHLQGSERGRDVTSRVGFNVRLPSDNLYRGVLDSITVDRSGGVSGKGGDHDEILVKHIITRNGGLPGMYDDLCQVFAPRDQVDGTGLLILAKYSDEFLDSQYEDGGDGELFKLELIYYPTTTVSGDVEDAKLPLPDSVLGTDVKDLGDDPEAYRWTYLKENRTDRNNYAPMVELAKAFSLSGDALDARMEELMDVDEWMRALAVISLIGCADIYTYGNSHNAIFYFRPEDGKAMLFPWDMDFAYYRSATDGFPGTSSANTLKLVNRPQNMHAYYGHLYDISSVTGDSEYIEKWAAHYSGLLGESWANAAAFLNDRATYVRSQLPLAVPFEITSNLGGDFSVSGSPVTIAGTGSITLKSITMNGVGYPVTWTTATDWTITVPLRESTNQIALQAYDLHGEILDGAVDTITIINLGALASQPVVINEWLADNSGPAGYPDPADQKFQDWFELYNPNDISVDLSGYTLTDNLEQPGKWSIPTNTFIAAHGFLLIWADDDSEQNGSGTNGDLHAAFKLSADGESLGLYSPEGVRQHAFTFGEQIENVSQGFYPDGSISAVYGMPGWSPRSPNRIAAPTAPDIIVFETRSGDAVTIHALTEPDHVYVIEYKNSLQESDWVPLCTNRAMTGVSSFVDPSATAGVTQRFYRAVRLQ
jgi:hypothetical protein